MADAQHWLSSVPFDITATGGARLKDFLRFAQLSKPHTRIAAKAPCSGSMWASMIRLATKISQVGELQSTAVAPTPSIKARFAFIVLAMHVDNAGATSTCCLSSLQAFGLLHASSPVACRPQQLAARDDEHAHQTTDRTIRGISAIILLVT